MIRHIKWLGRQLIAYIHVREESLQIDSGVLGDMVFDWGPRLIAMKFTAESCKDSSHWLIYCRVIVIQQLYWEVGYLLLES